MMQWYNEPANVAEENDVISVTTRPRHDFWRVTRYDFIKDDGHFYYEDVVGDFVADVKITGAYKDQYDQAGMMIRQDALVWMKCGIELLDGVQQASMVVTRDFSDWSVVPLNTNPKTIWLRMERIGSAIETSFSLDGETFTMMRQAYLSESESLQVGLMCCSPVGEGFNVSFEGFKISD